jgi:hypothetical protein
VRPHLFRLVPDRRLPTAEAVLATCPRPVAVPTDPTGERRVWELVDPGADDAEFAAAVVVTEHASDGGSARVVTVAIADPDVDGTTSQVLSAVVAELTRTGADVVMPSEARGREPG